MRVWALILPLLCFPALAQERFTPAQRGEVVQILRQALREDPSILREAMAALEAAEAQAREAASLRAIVSQREALERNPADPVRGNPRGDVTVVEFFDVRCSFCRQMQPVMAELLRRDGNLRLVMKDLPILGPASVLAARALMAAQRQGRYAELQAALMAVRGDVTEPVLRREAERLGLDWERLREAMDDPAVTARIEANLAMARSIGIEGTPALVIGDRLVGGAVPLETLLRQVAEARAARR